MKLSLLLYSLLLFTHVSHASTKLSVLTEDWYPFNYQYGDQVIGSSTIYVKQLLEQAQLDYEIEVREWSEAYAILSSEPNTLLYSTFKTPSRTPLFHWICPINHPIYSSIYALSNRQDISAQNFKDLKAYSMGITQETYPYNLFKSLGFIEGKHLHVTKNNSSNLGMLLRGRVDIIAESDMAIVEMLKQHHVPQSHVKKILFIEDPNQPDICLAISKNTAPKLVDKLQQAHKQLLEQKPIPTKMSKLTL